jgi:hypothetical protein
MLDRLRIDSDATDVTPTTRLGDWYANTFNGGRTVFVLAVSERSLLPVIVTAAPKATLIPRFIDAACDSLLAIGLDAPIVDAERRAMTHVRFGRTIDRRVLGTMTDFVRMLYADLTVEDAAPEALKLAEAPCKPIGMKSPRRRTLELFRG